MKKLSVTVTKEGTPFLEGTFTVEPEDYDTVVDLLDSIDMSDEQARSILAGYMHARDVDQPSEEMGKIAMVAAVFMLRQGQESVNVSL